MRLNIRAFALTCAILWGLAIFLVTWWVILWQGISDPPEVTLLGRIYKGYTVSYAGSVVGLLWGFVDGLIGGAVFAWLYNLLAGKFGGRAGAPAAEA